MITDRNMDPNAGVMQQVRRFGFDTPVSDTDLVVDAESLNGAAVGDTFDIANGWLPLPMSLLLTLTDASGTNLSATFLVTGEDQHGNIVEDTISATGAATTSHGTKVFRRVTQVKLTAIANAAAGDLIDLGIGANNSSIIFGLPVHLRKTSTNGVGSYRDTVQAVWRNGAINTGAWVAQPAVNGITGVAVSSGSVMLILLDMES